jgi:hypothetical protein
METKYISIVSHGITRTGRKHSFESYPHTHSSEPIIVPKDVYIVSYSVPGKFSYPSRDNLFTIYMIKYGLVFVEIYTQILLDYGISFINKYVNEGIISNNDLMDKYIHIFLKHNVILKADKLKIINDAVLSILDSGDTNIVYYNDKGNLVTTSERIQNVRINVPGTWIENRVLNKLQNEAFTCETSLLTNKIINEKLFECIAPSHMKFIDTVYFDHTFMYTKLLGVHELENMVSENNGYHMEGTQVYIPHISQMLVNKLNDPYPFDVFTYGERPTKVGMSKISTIKNGAYLIDVINELQATYPGQRLVIFLNSCRVLSESKIPKRIECIQRKEIESYFRQLARGSVTAQTPVTQRPQGIPQKPQYAMRKSVRKNRKSVKKSVRKNRKSVKKSVRKNRKSVKKSVRK